MNFTNQRFSIPSICEYSSLEVVSSPTKKRSGPNQSMDFKMDLLAFQSFRRPIQTSRRVRDLLTMHQHPLDYSESIKAILAIFGVKSHKFSTALFPSRLARFLSTFLQ